MTAVLSHLDHFMHPGAAGGALGERGEGSGAILWYGMAEEEEIERLAAYGGPMIEIIKPYADEISFTGKSSMRKSSDYWPWALISTTRSRTTALGPCFRV